MNLMSGSQQGMGMLKKQTEVRIIGLLPLQLPSAHRERVW